MMSSKKGGRTNRKLAVSIFTILFLISLLGATTYALIVLSVSVDDNYFKTGSIEINLNDGKPVLNEDEYLFEPGMTVTKSFFIENLSTWEVYYKIYLDDVAGDLSSVLEITISDGDKVLFEGTADELTRSSVKAADDVLEVNEKRDLTITFHYPEAAGNSTQARTLSFKLCAEAVQTKNNPDKLFD